MYNKQKLINNKGWQKIYREGCDDSLDSFDDSFNYYLNLDTSDNKWEFGCSRFWTGSNSNKNNEPIQVHINVCVLVL